MTNPDKPSRYHTSTKRSALFAVTGHGFGHAVRSSLVMRALIDRHRFSITVRTSAPGWLFPADVAVEPATLDVGVVQKDALTPDLAATAQWWERLLLHDFERRVAEEVAAIERINPDVVVADIAPLGVAAGKAAGRPTVVEANFLWDWIFEGYAASSPILEALAPKVTAIYEQADRIYRTPFSDGMERYQNVTDIPLIARRSTLGKEAARLLLGLPRDEPLALVSMGGAGLDRFFHRLNRRLTVARPFTFGDEPGERDGMIVLPRSFAHVDAMAAADLVIGKLGYGLCGELAAIGRGILYTPRTDFVEYFTLAREIGKLVPTEEVDETTYFEGSLDPAVGRLMKAGMIAPAITIDGAARAADLIAERRVT